MDARCLSLVMLKIKIHLSTCIPEYKLVLSFLYWHVRRYGQSVYSTSLLSLIYGDAPRNDPLAQEVAVSLHQARLITRRNYCVYFQQKQKHNKLN